MGLGYGRGKLSWAAMIVIAVCLAGFVAADAVQAATPPGFETLGWNIKKGQWAEGNIGQYPEGSFFGTQVRVTNGSSAPLTLTEIDVTYSFFDGSSAIGIDWARRFFYSTTTCFKPGDTDRYPYSPAFGGGITPDPGWQELPGGQPFIWNMPWIGTIGTPGTSESQTAPNQEHVWGINPAALLPGGVLAPGQSLTIYFEPHLSLSFIWLNGKEGLLPIEGTWSGGDVDRSGWTAKWQGSGYFPGSKMHGYLQSDVTGKKTLPVPAVTMLAGSIAGRKVEDLNLNGVQDGAEVGIAGWPITLQVTLDDIDIELDTVTGAGGSYQFTTLPDAQFAIVEGAPPAGYEDYKPTPGTLTTITLHLPLQAGEGAYGTVGSRTATNVNFYNWPKVHPDVTTTLSDNTITLGESVTDSVTVSSGAIAVVPSGTVDFKVSYNGGPFNPWAGSTGIALDGSGTATSPSYTPMATGGYRFQAFYNGDSNFYAGHSDPNDPDEALLVEPATPGVKTTLSDNTITLGDSVTDSVTVTGVLGIVPTGTVDFKVSYGGGAFQTWTGSTGIALNGSGTATSPAYAPLAAGNYRFQAFYSGDSNYLAASSDPDDADEALSVERVQKPATTVLQVVVTDTVTIASLPSPFPGPTGTVDFQVSANGGAWSTFDSGVALVSGSATSSPYTLPAPGSYRFRALYSGDSNYQPSQSGADDEPVTYDDNS